MMRLWLLLVLLLISDLSLLGDGDWIIDYLYWPLCSKLLLSRLEASTKELQTGLTWAVRSCPCLQKEGVYVAKQEQRSLSLYWTRRVYYSNQDPAGIVHRIHFPGMAVTSFYGTGKHFPTFRDKLNTLPALHIISEHIHNKINVIPSIGFQAPSLDRPYIGSGRSFPAFLLEKSKLSRALVAGAELWNKRPKHHRAAMRIKEAQEKDLTKNRQTEKRWRAFDLKDPLWAKIRKKQKSLQRQLSLKAESRRHAGSVYMQGLPLLALRKNKGSIYRSQYAIRLAWYNDIEYFSKKSNAEEAELHSPQGERKVENPKTNRENTGIQPILAHNLRIKQTPNANYYDARGETMLFDVRKDTFILLIPPTEMKTEAEQSKATITEIGDPPPVIKSFISKMAKSKYNCFFGEKSLLKVYLIETREMTDLKLSNKILEVTTVSVATEATEAAQENVAFNITDEANTTMEVSATPSAHSLKVTQAETRTARFLTEPTTTKTANQFMTEVFSRSSTTEIQSSSEQRQTAPPNQESHTDFEPRFITRMTHNTKVTSKVQFPGLRMRDDAKIITKGPEKNDEKGSDDRPAADRRHGLVHHGGKTQTFSKSSEDVKSKGTEDGLKTKGSTRLCRGLIDRSEAGWTHCMDRLGGTPSNAVSVWETPEAEPTRGDDHKPLSDGEDHFYYFNGILKRVRNNARVYNKRRRRRATEDAIKGTKGQDS